MPLHGRGMNYGSFISYNAIYCQHLKWRMMDWNAGPEIRYRSINILSNACVAAPGSCTAAALASFHAAPQLLHILALRLFRLELPVDSIKPRKGIVNAFLQSPGTCADRISGSKNRRSFSRCRPGAAMRRNSRVLPSGISTIFECCLDIFHAQAVLVRHDRLASRERLRALRIEIAPCHAVRDLDR